MLSPRRLPRWVAVAIVLFAVLLTSGQLARQPGGRGPHGQPARATATATVTTTAATSPAGGGGPCSVPGIGDIGGLLGFCSLGSSGALGTLNSLCQPGNPQPESASAGLDALVKPPGSPGRQLATPYNQYGMAGQYWAATNLQCSDMTSLIGNDVAGMLFDFAKAIDRVTVTVYQSAAGEGILGWLQGVTDHLISGLGNAIYFPYVAVVVILAAIWLAWQGLIRKRGTRTIEGTVWIVVACAAAIWLIGRPADFTGLGKGVSDGISTTLNAAFAHLPSPGQASCLPVAPGDPQISPSSFSYTAGPTVVDQNANELWTVLVCKPWLDGEFGATAYATAGGRPTPVNVYARGLLWAQAIAVNERSTPALMTAKQDAYAGIARSIQQHDPSVYPLFQGKEWTTRLEIAFAALLAALVAGVLVLLISVTLILLKLGFLLLLIVGPFFLLIGTHPGFGRVIAVRWFEMLVGVLLKQAAVALALSVLLYCYALIMGTADSVLPWALKILMITLVTVAVFIYRKPFQHLFAAVGYGAIGSTDRAEADLSRAASSARANTMNAATLAVPGFAAYRAARWARRNPAQAAGLALGAATASGTVGVAAGAALGADGSGGAAGGDGHEFAGAGSAAGGTLDGATAQAGAASRARAWGASAGTASASQAPPLRLSPRPGTPASWVNGGSPGAGSRGNPAGSGGGPGNGRTAAPGPASAPPLTRPPSSVPPARRPSPGPPPVGSPSGGASAGGGSAGGGPAWSGRRRGPGRSAGAQGSPGSPRPVPDDPGAGSPGRAARPPRPGRAARPARQARQGRPGGQARPGADRGGTPDAQGESPGLPFGGQPGQADEGPAGPFWLRPVRRRK